MTSKKQCWRGATEINSFVQMNWSTWLNSIKEALINIVGTIITTLQSSLVPKGAKSTFPKIELTVSVAYIDMLRSYLEIQILGQTTQS